MTNVTNYIFHVTDTGGNGIAGITPTLIRIKFLGATAIASLSTSLSVSTTPGAQTTIVSGAGSVVLYDQGNGDYVAAYDPVASGDAVLELTCTKAATTFAGGGVFSVPMTRESPLILASLTATGALIQGIFQKNVAFPNFHLKMVLSSDHVTPATGKTVTGQVAIDGAAFANLTNAVTEVSAGWYLVNLAAADLNGTDIAMKFVATGCDQTDLKLVVQ